MSASKQGNRVTRTAERKRLRNRLVRSTVKTCVAKARSSIDAAEESASQRIVLTVSTIDRATSKGIIHGNKGARLKSRLMKKLTKK